MAHDVVRAGGGRFVLRIEDIDAGRSRPEFMHAILADLAWLGIAWDGAPLVQASRARAHTAALARLQDMGLVYRCVCTRADIAASVAAPHGDAPSVYPGTCRRVLVAIDDLRPSAWRLDTAKAIDRAGPLSWHDADAGGVVADPGQFGDIAVARKDAGTSYHLACVVDDAHQGVTFIVRGRDLFAATHVQRLLQALLNLPAPAYRHHPLILGSDGRRLAKRTPGATLADLRAGGTDPVRLLADLRAGRLPIGFAFDSA